MVLRNMKCSSIFGRRRSYIGLEDPREMTLIEKARPQSNFRQRKFVLNKFGARMFNSHFAHEVANR